METHKTKNPIYFNIHIYKYISSSLKKIQVLDLFDLYEYREKELVGIVVDDANDF